MWIGFKAKALGFVSERSVYRNHPRFIFLLSFELSSIEPRKQKMSYLHDYVCLYLPLQKKNKKTKKT